MVLRRFRCKTCGAILEVDTERKIYNIKFTREATPYSPKRSPHYPGRCPLTLGLTPEELERREDVECL